MNTETHHHPPLHTNPVHKDGKLSNDTPLGQPNKATGSDKITSSKPITSYYSSAPQSGPVFRGGSYLTSTRNTHLPETVRRWLAEGEGSAQDNVERIEVGEWRERSSLDLKAPPHCPCCVSALPEGHYPVRVRLAESETCHAFDEVIEVGPECVGDWREAEARV